MPIEKTPANPLPLFHMPAGGFPYRVKDGDNWRSVASKFLVDVNVLIDFNFKTNNPDEVNWYLRRNVGCRKATKDGLNWMFSADAQPGIIFLPPPTPVSVQPQPLDEGARLKVALDALEVKVNASQDPGRHRYICWIAKLRADADDRVIQWHKIYPHISGPIGAALMVGGSDPSAGTPVNQTLLEGAITSVQHVESADQRLGFITHMRKDIVETHEMTSESLHLENFRKFQDEVIRTIDKLEKWSNAPMGGSSAMPKAYRFIKEWIRGQQSNVKSVYSCG